jgi:hypothetical protein
MSQQINDSHNFVSEVLNYIPAIKPIVFAAIVTAGITLADVELILKIVFWAVSITVACWKWHSDYRKQKHLKVPKPENKK